MIKSLCQFAAKHLPSFTIAKDDVKYLTRYYLLCKDRKYFNIFLHHSHSSDLDKGEKELGLLHSHPWRKSFGLILVNGYAEERLQHNGNIIVKLVKPWAINFLSENDFHRVDLIAEDAWSIFFTSSRSENLDWYFYDRVSKKRIFWKEVAGAIE
jgi:hypothetical protein